MSGIVPSSNSKGVVAIGPVMPGWGSWDWVGADMAAELAKYYAAVTFQPGEITDADVRLIIKHPDLPGSEPYSSRPAIVFCPIDLYGSPAEIDADAGFLRGCSRIIVHCERLRRYFEPYAPVEYLDHHVKFVSPNRKRYRDRGFLLWVGVRTNLPPLVEWVNEHPLPVSLHVLANFENPERLPSPADLGFRAATSIRLENWTPELHLQLLTKARAALDIKGDDFRSRHKPPAKALDFIASGVPLAMNLDSSAGEHLARLGFDLASPLDTERWLSKTYWDETRKFGEAIREMLSRERIGRRLRRIIGDVLNEQR